MSNVRITPKSVEQCFALWKTGRGIKHKGPHVCIRDAGHERECLCSCGSKHKKEVA